MNDRRTRVRPRVLLVEDDADVRSLAERVLSGAGYEVAVAADGTTALDILGRTAPDVIVLDVQMPDVDGWTVLERIRADPSQRSTRVLMCTVKTASEDEPRARRLRPDGHLAKPYLIRDLEDAVRTLTTAGDPQAGRDP